MKRKQPLVLHIITAALIGSCLLQERPARSGQPDELPPNVWFKVDRASLASGSLLAKTFDSARRSLLPDYPERSPLRWCYGQYALVPETGRTYALTRTNGFDAGTFVYEPAQKAWQALPGEKVPASGVENGPPYWGSMCYMAHLKRILLFGGCSGVAGRRDPGTWLYDPAQKVWEQLAVEKQPPQRANSQLAYDPVSRKAVVFGGDHLDSLLADTWTFDGEKWQEAVPALSPSPRGGHAFVWLPGARRVLLLGGYGYHSGTQSYNTQCYRALPLEMWVYDVAGNRWAFVARFAPGATAPPNCSAGHRANSLVAAVGKGDIVLLRAGRAGDWLCRVDVSKPDTEETANCGVKPGTVERRTGCHDPAWYREDSSPADSAQVDRELTALKPNTWTLRPASPRHPSMIDGAWGSAVLCPERDCIIRFNGGHCVYSGTAPLIYDIKTNRYGIPYAPEMALDFCANDVLHCRESFNGHPWMSGHTRSNTAYDPLTRTLVYSNRAYTYFFDPADGQWSRSPKPSPFETETYGFYGHLCATPKGMVHWHWGDRRVPRLYLLGADRTWKELTVKSKIPMATHDSHAIVYDSKRDRLLLFCGGRSGFHEFRMASSEMAERSVGTMGNLPSRFREAVYLAQSDMVLFGARVRVRSQEPPLWLVYDAGKNAWSGARLMGEAPFRSEPEPLYDSSVALMYDPNRKLVWAMDVRNRVYALKFDPSSELVPLTGKDLPAPPR
jgi:hypothetical protein